MCWNYLRTKKSTNCYILYMCFFLAKIFVLIWSGRYYFCFLCERYPAIYLIFYLLFADDFTESIICLIYFVRIWWECLLWCEEMEYFWWWLLWVEFWECESCYLSGWLKWSRKLIDLMFSSVFLLNFLSSCYSNCVNYTVFPRRAGLPQSHCIFLHPNPFLSTCYSYSYLGNERNCTWARKMNFTMQLEMNIDVLFCFNR